MTQEKVSHSSLNKVLHLSLKKRLHSKLKKMYHTWDFKKGSHQGF